jgi:hypothetical protein
LEEEALSWIRGVDLLAEQGRKDVLLAGKVLMDDVL